MKTNRCGSNYFTGEHIYTPWVQERWKPSLDTRVCRLCKHYEVRKHVRGTEMFPEWLAHFEAVERS